MDEPIAPAISRRPARGAARAASSATRRAHRGALSALVEDRNGSSFAGQFESFLGWTAKTISSPRCAPAGRRCGRRARCATWRRTISIPPIPPWRCWCSRSSPRSAAGGALSRTADGDMLINATWGLGSAIAQGEVTPDRYVLSRDGQAARGRHRLQASDHAAAAPTCASRPPQLVRALAHALPHRARRRRSSAGSCSGPKTLMGMPVEIEWAMDEAGFKLLQARPLHLQPAPVAGRAAGARHPRLNGQPAGVGWATGRACVVNCECELIRVAPGDVLVTRMAGPGARADPAARRRRRRGAAAAAPPTSPRSRASAAYPWCWGRSTRRSAYRMARWWRWTGSPASCAGRRPRRRFVIGD